MRYNSFKEEVCTVRQRWKTFFCSTECIKKCEKKITMTIQTLTEIMASYKKL